MRLRRSLSVCFWALGVISLASYPKQVAHAAREEAQNTIEEVTVTAQRREQRVQDIPASITALSATELAARGVEHIGDITDAVPNAALENNGLVTRFVIRGITLNDTGETTDAPIALYVDDVYQSAVAAVPGLIMDVERVEVLSGPQGTLYGRNTTGGLVHYISHMPTAKAEGYARIEAGSFGSVVAEGAFSGPLSERIRARLAVKLNSDAGFQTNLVNGDPWGKKNERAGRLLVDMDLTDSVRVLLNVHGSDLNDDMAGYGFFGTRQIGNLSAECTVAQIYASQCADKSGFRDPNPHPTRIYSEQSRLPAVIKTRGGAATLTADLSDMTLTSITAYEGLKKNQAEDFDATANPIGIDTTTAKSNQYSEEIRLADPHGRIPWVAGVYIYKDDKHVIFGYPTFGLPVANTSKVTTKSYALFGQADVPLGDSYTLTLGLRGTHESREHDDVIFNGATPAGAQSVFQTGRFSISETKPTGRVAIDWKESANVHVYGSVATGFKSGAFNTTGLFAAAEGAPVGSERNTAYEIGEKSEFAGGRIRANLSGFYYNYKGIQQVLSTSTALSVIQSIGDARVYGAEFETQFAPIEHLLFELSPATLHTKISSSIPAYDGGTLPNAPKFSVKGFARYSLPVSDTSAVRLEANFRWQSKVRFAPDANPLKAQDSYGVVNARISWATDDDHYDLGIFCENCANKNYFSHAFDLNGFTGGAIAIWGMPREYGLYLKTSL